MCHLKSQFDFISAFCWHSESVSFLWVFSSVHYSILPNILMVSSILRDRIVSILFWESQMAVVVVASFAATSAAAAGAVAVFKSQHIFNGFKCERFYIKCTAVVQPKFVSQMVRLCNFYVCRHRKRYDMYVRGQNSQLHTKCILCN